ncbi:hypothetical protein EV651_11235 [Kribbella sp. VKM Ac-2571]|nr:hypothetical protein EV651_11235 [Kribbella sp. VKM Ac-2571]
MILVSPGPRDWRDDSPNALFGYLAGAQKRHLFGLALQPRPLTTYVFAHLDPARARTVVSDPEADAISDELQRGASPALYCIPPWDPPVGSTGFYRMQSGPLPPGQDESRELQRSLKQLDVPTMILKGSCGYMFWRSVMKYWELIGRPSVTWREPGTTCSRKARTW